MRNSRGARASVAAFVLLAVVLACDGDVYNELPSPETGVSATVIGRVMSYTDGKSIPDATWEIVGTGKSGACDAAGGYTASGLGLGSYILSVTAPGHATTDVTVVVQPSNNVDGRQVLYLAQDVYLPEKNAGLTATLYTAHDGAPARFARYECIWDHGISRHSVHDSDVPTGGVADTNGVITLTDMPAMELLLVVHPYDVDGDGHPEYPTRTMRVDLEPNSRLSPTLILYEDYGSVSIVSDNITSYGVHTDVPLYCVFNSVMDTRPEAIAVELIDYATEDRMLLSLDWTSDIRLEIMPNVNMLDPQGEYYLLLKARSAGGFDYQNSWTRMTFDFGAGPGGYDCADIVQDLMPALSAGPPDFNTVAFPLQWSAVSCAGGYNIYARDDRFNPNWVLVDYDPTDYDYGTVNHVVSLPDDFDRYYADAVQTPLAGVEVEFAVVPARAVERSPDAGHASISVADITPPSIVSVSQQGSSWNAGPSAQGMELSVYFSEFIDPAAGDPSLTITEAGGDPAFTLDPATATWTWYAGRQQGTFFFSVPAMTNASDDIATVKFLDLTDMSGNATPGESSSSPYALTASSYFDFESGPQGWVATGVDGWRWGRPSYSPSGGYESENCWMMNADGDVLSDVDVRLTSPVIGVPSNSPSLTFRIYRRMSSSQQLYVLADNGTETQLTQMSVYDPSWREETVSLAAFAGQAIRLVFHYTATSLSGSYGVYIDNVKVASSP